METYLYGFIASAILAMLLFRKDYKGDRDMWVVTCFLGAFSWATTGGLFVALVFNFFKTLTNKK